MHQFMHFEVFHVSHLYNFKVFYMHHLYFYYKIICMDHLYLIYSILYYHSYYVKYFIYINYIILEYIYALGWYGGHPDTGVTQTLLIETILKVISWHQLWVRKILALFSHRPFWGRFASLLWFWGKKNVFFNSFYNF